MNIYQPKDELVAKVNRFVQPIGMSSRGSIAPSRIEPYWVDLIPDCQSRSHNPFGQARHG